MKGPVTAIQPDTPLDLAYELKAPLLGLYGGADDGINIADVQEAASRARKRGTEVHIEVFPAHRTAFMPTTAQPIMKVPPRLLGVRRLPGFGAMGLFRQVRKHFFSEEKKQKTFASCCVLMNDP